MKLVLSLICVTLTTIVSGTIVFHPPRYPLSPAEIPDLFPQRSKDDSTSQRYPLAIEAVLSVALKLQAIEDHDGKQENFLVSPLAVAGALGQLMLGARGDLQNQIAVLLTLHQPTNNGVPNRSATPSQPQVPTNPSTTVNQRISDPDIVTPVVDKSGVVSRFGTVSALNAESYQVQRAEMPQFASTSSAGLPGLELHRQLGSLIRELSTPLAPQGVVYPVTNNSYLHSGSAFFVDRQMNLSEPFVRAIIDFYDSKVVPVDFKRDSNAAQNAVNDWGSKETGGLIKQFLTYPPPLDTAVIQTVAVHFRGAWQTPFIPEGTISGLFKTAENKEVPVKYMRGSFEEVSYAENRDLRIRLLAMPYANFDCTMYVILPMDNHPLKFNVGHMVSQLTSKDLADLVGLARKRTVNVMFPRLSLTGSLRIASALEKHAEFSNKEKMERENSRLNSTTSRNAEPSQSSSANTKKSVVSQSTSRPPVQQTTLDPLRVIPLGQPQSGVDSEANNIQITGRNAPDVSELGGNGVSQETVTNPELTLVGAADNSKFRISEIVQNIALEVNEAGTEAAAIAGSTINYSGDVKNFLVNRPFLFFIRHENTNAILFWGTIVDPSA